jgi:simple sugar transport system ATP-binding protein
MVGRDVMLTLSRAPVKPGKITLRTRNLNVYDEGGTHRVKNVDFTLRAGEILGICGMSGSGQNELVETLVGLRRPAKGSEIELLGIDVTHESVGKRRTLGMGYVTQDRSEVGTNREASIWENAIMGSPIAAEGFILNKRAAAEFTRQLIGDCSIRAQNVHQKVRTLSGGNVQKLLVGREFPLGRNLLIIENPTRGIDIGAVELIWGKIIEMGASGRAILLISQELNEVIQLSSRIMVMYDGGLSQVEGNFPTEEEIGLLMLGGITGHV